MPEGADAGSRSAGDGGVVRDGARLRSAGWFSGAGVRAFSHRSRLRQLGVAAADHEGRPVIAILNTWSELNPCHAHLRERAEAVNRGEWQAGGGPPRLCERTR